MQLHRQGLILITQCVNKEACINIHTDGFWQNVKTIVLVKGSGPDGSNLVSHLLDELHVRHDEVRVELSEQSICTQAVAMLVIAMHHPLA